jgi:hypothetical protein
MEATGSPAKMFFVRSLRRIQEFMRYANIHLNVDFKCILINIKMWIVMGKAGIFRLVSRAYKKERTWYPIRELRKIFTSH